MTVSFSMGLLLWGLAPATGLQQLAPAALQFQPSTNAVLELGEEDLHNGPKIMDALLSSDSVVAAADAAANEIAASEALRTKAHSTILQAISKSKSGLGKPQQLVEEVHQALAKEGVLALAKDVGKKMAKAHKAKRDRGDSWATVDSYFIGWGLHIGPRLPMAPGADALFFIPICASEDGCTFDYEQEEAAVANGTAAKLAESGDGKFCGAIMGGVSPDPGNAANYMAPPVHTLVPYFTFGGGSFKYAAGSFLESGGGYENDYFDLVTMMKVKPSFQKMKAFVFETSSPRLNMVTLAKYTSEKLKKQLGGVDGWLKWAKAIQEKYNPWKTEIQGIDPEKATREVEEVLIKQARKDLMDIGLEDEDGQLLDDELGPKGPKSLVDELEEMADPKQSKEHDDEVGDGDMLGLLSEMVKVTDEDDEDASEGEGDEDDQADEEGDEEGDEENDEGEASDDEPGDDSEERGEEGGDESDDEGENDGDRELSDQFEQLLGEPGTGSLDKAVLGEAMSKRVKELASSAKERMTSSVKSTASSVTKYVQDNVLPRRTTMDGVSDLAKGKDPSVVKTMDNIDNALNDPNGPIDFESDEGPVLSVPGFERKEVEDAHAKAHQPPSTRFIVFAGNAWCTKERIG